MSQGDYIRRKKISHKLIGDGTTNGELIGNGLSKYSSVLDSDDYIDFKKYGLEGTITSDNVSFNNLTVGNKTNIFGMNLNVSNCPTFVVCGTQYTNSESENVETYMRINRVPSGQPPNCNPVMKAPGRSVPPIWDENTKKITSKYVYPAYKRLACNCKNTKTTIVDGKIVETFIDCFLCR